MTRRGVWPPRCEKCDEPRTVGLWCARHAVWARETGRLK